MQNVTQSTVFISPVPRELFNAALFGVLEQGKPSYDTYAKNCKYELDDGSARCGVGHCLTLPALEVVKEFDGGVMEMVDEIISESDDGDLIDNAINTSEVLVEFLDTLQTAHDQAERAAQRLEDRRDFVEEFTANMTELALEYFGHEDLDITIGIPE